MNYFKIIIYIYFIFICIISLISLIKKYIYFNDKLIEAKKFDYIINEYDKNQLIEKIELLNNEIKKFNNSQNIKDDKINSNKDIIIKNQKNEIDKLKEKLSNYPFKLSKGEKLISVIFTSSDQNMFYSIICKNTQKFIELEQKLYKDYPEYSKSDNYFMIKGNRVKKDKSLDENKIRNSDIIILTQNNI